MEQPIDPVFEFSEIGHHGIERWSFSKEHLPHVLVVAPNLRNVERPEGIPEGFRASAKSYRAAASRKKSPCAPQRLPACRILSLQVGRTRADTNGPVVVASLDLGG